MAAGILAGHEIPPVVDELPVISLLALATAVTLSGTTKINVGILAMAWRGLGVYLAGRPLAEIAARFPT